MPRPLVLVPTTSAPLMPAPSACCEANPALCEIMAVETDGDGVAITARTRAFGGFSETWKPPSDGVYITVFTETWES